jgi:hypothetical protein
VIVRDQPTAPYVPAEALRLPAGAVIDSAGHVTCVTCKASVALAKADVVGMGYRCAPCSHKADLALLTGGGDAASHFSAAERRGLSESGMLLVVCGGLALLAGVVLIAMLFYRVGIAVLVGSCGMISAGLARHNAAH